MSYLELCCLSSKCLRISFCYWLLVSKIILLLLLLSLENMLLRREGNGNPLQSSCQENPMDGGAWQVRVHGVTKSWTWLSDFTSLTSYFVIGEGNGNPLQYFCLENPMDRGAWQAMVHGFAEGWTHLKWLSSSSMLCMNPDLWSGLRSFMAQKLIYLINIPHILGKYVNSTVGVCSVL